MTVLRTLQDHALAASRYGKVASARYVLRHLADRKGWCDETFRARWDGAAALLSWWYSLDPVVRPPLDDLTEADARAFLENLEARGLARSTLRGYRAGAVALTCALRACRAFPVTFDEEYAPFGGVHLTPVRISPPPTVSNAQLTGITSHVVRARLELLLSLTALGLSLPEACSRCWGDLNLKQRILAGYRGRTLGLGVDAVTALETLIALRPNSSGGQRILGWQPPTARTWLKRVQTRLNDR